MSIIEKIMPESRTAWLAARRRDITASQIGGLLGVHPYTTRYQLWAEKTGRLAPDDDLDSAALQRGRLLERLAADMATDLLPHGSTTERNTQNGYWRDPVSRIGATPDLIVNNTRGLGNVQLKSIEPTIFNRTWINGEPPLWIALQAITEANLIGAQWAAVGALRVGFRVEFDLIEIPLTPQVWFALKTAASKFWAEVETGTVPAPDFARDAGVIGMLAGASAEKTIDLSTDNELCAALADREALKARQKATAIQIDAHDALIRHKAGDAEVLLAGEFRVSLRTQQVKAYSVPARAQRPIIAKRIKGEGPADAKPGGG